MRKARRHKGTKAQRALIIGGGPAGSSAAFHLVRDGWDVTLVETKTFPRAKVCGEFISPAATEILEEIVSPEVLRGAGARHVHEFILEVDRRSAHWRMPMASGQGAWVLSRRSLDGLLLDATRDLGATILQPARVRAVRYFDDHVEAVVARASELETIDSDIVVHADGAGRFDAPDENGRIRTTPMRQGVVALKCHIRLPMEHRIGGLLMRSVRGAYIGMVGVEDGQTTLALVARKSVAARFAGDTDAMLRSLWPDYDRNWRESDWLACGVAGSGFVEPGHARSFRVGNAVGAVEPVGGEGIGMALWSGREISLALDRHEGTKARRHKGPYVEAQRAYGHAYRRRLRWRRPACRLAAEVLMRPALIDALWPILAAPLLRDALLAPWYRLTGKPGAI